MASQEVIHDAVVLGSTRENLEGNVTSERNGLDSEEWVPQGNNFERSRLYFWKPEVRLCITLLLLIRLLVVAGTDGRDTCAVRVSRPARWIPLENSAATHLHERLSCLQEVLSTLGLRGLLIPINDGLI